MDPTFNVYSDGLSGTSSPSSNLYFANLPLHYSERNLEELLLPWPVISTKILRTTTGASRGVGFALLHCKENCSKVIQLLNGAVLGTKPLTVKFARCGFGEVGQTNSGGPRPGLLLQGHRYHYWALVPVIPVDPLYTYEPAVTLSNTTTATLTATATYSGQPWPQPQQCATVETLTGFTVQH